MENFMTLINSLNILNKSEDLSYNRASKAYVDYANIKIYSILFSS